MVLGREVLGRRHFTQRRVDVPEWGGEVILRSLSQAEATKVQALASAGVDAQKRQIKDGDAVMRMTCLAVAYGWVDEDGANVLTPSEALSLAQEERVVLDRLATAVLELSGLGGKRETTEDEEPDILDAFEKN
jgi:hypothetical protein